MYQPILELLSSFRCWRIFYSVNCYITELLFEKYFFSQISFGFLFFSLFNFQGSISLPLARQLTEYITSLLPYQVLFLTFFKVFRESGMPVIHSLFPFCPSGFLLSLLRRSQNVPYYIIRFCLLSIPFFIFFSPFSHSLYALPGVFACEYSFSHHMLYSPPFFHFGV